MNQMYCYCKKGVLVVHESRCIVTVRKECWWYMNQSRCIVTVRIGVLVVHESDVRCIVTVRIGVLVVHESDVRCIITVRKESWWYMTISCQMYYYSKKGSVDCT